jgi:hypothetical protein
VFTKCMHLGILGNKLCIVLLMFIANVEVFAKNLMLKLDIEGLNGSKHDWKSQKGCRIVVKGCLYGAI